MVGLAGIFQRFRRCRVLAIGDLVLDKCVVGKVRRISPEAPVPVVHVEREESRLGMTGNVALNLLALGAEVTLMGQVGDDAAGRMLRSVLEEAKIGTEGLVVNQGYPTPVKTRVLADNQQIVRVDREEVCFLPEDVEKRVVDSLLPRLLDQVDIVAVSDYAKGFLTRTLLEKLIELCRERDLAVIVDPKGCDFTRYRGATLVKPNQSEAVCAAGVVEDGEASLDEIAEKLLQQTEADTLMITRSQKGIALFSRDGTREDFCVRGKDIKDVTGAGDTVLATMTVGLANGLTPQEAAQLSNVAAGIAIEHLGCHQVTFSELAQRLLKEDSTNKVFAEEQLFVLQAALQGKTCSVLGLNTDEGFSPAVFRAVQELAKNPDRKLIVYLRDDDPCEEVIALLSSLRQVDFVILRSEGLEHFVRQVQPESVYVVEEQRLYRVENFEALVMN